MTEEELRAAPEADYMSPAQLIFFRERLMAMREELRTRQVELRENLETADVPTDPADRATREEQEWLEMRLRERESTLLQKIDESLRRIHANEYGYCTKSGDPIGIQRLLARPTATTAIYT